MTAINASRWIRLTGVFLLLAVFMSRAAFAAGYMPGGQRDGQVFLVEMCGEVGAHHTVAIKLPGDEPAQEDASDISQCPFALSFASVLPDHAPVLEASEAQFYASALVYVPAIPLADAWRAHAPPTGPPLH